MIQERFRLGKICKYGHEAPDHPGSGIYYIKGGRCVECACSAKRNGRGKIRGASRPKAKDDAERAEHLKANNLRWYREGGGKELAAARYITRYAANPELHKERARIAARKYRADPKKRAARLEQKRAAYKADPERFKENDRRHRHKPETLEKHRAYEKNRYDTDEQFMMRKRLRANFRGALRRHAKTRKAGTSKSYGIDYDAIVERLGPCPGNPAEWHIDHIRPLVSFDLTDPDQIREAFAPENHQWLLASDNMSKGCKFEDNIGLAT